ncbi:unnamed protein product [Durusdinium trenchii]|uniref:Uncharacterized protein n=3 Tax=Durusdinium trenchii TaxID=1381693 RepID=A0ABP0MVK9_9DINO
MACGVPSSKAMLRLVGVLLALARGEIDDGAHPRRLTTSVACREALEDMLRHENWMYVNNSQTRWCKLRLENTMATCCRIANFAQGRGEDCSGCVSSCIHQNMVTLCEKDFGQACIVKRKPFFRTGAPELEVHETFCVPKECNNGADRDALVAWFAAYYVARRDGWHMDYDEAVLECTSGVVTAIIVTITVIVCIVSCIPISIFLFKAPKERGRTLISQEQMQAESMRGDEDMDGTLRSTAGGGDTMGSSGMGATR